MGQPDMRDVLPGFSSRARFALVKQTVVDHEVKLDQGCVQKFSGVFEPLPAQRIAVKPEGQRTWKWWHLWTTQDLSVGDLVQDVCYGKLYKVMTRSDWSRAGFFDYELTENAD